MNASATEAIGSSARHGIAPIAKPLAGCLIGVAALGCSRIPDASAHASADQPVLPLAERLAQEAARVPALIGPRQVALAILYVIVAAVLARLMAGAVHGLWRLGFDQERRLGRWVVIGRLLLGLAVVYALLNEFVVAAPVLSGAALILFGAVAFIALRGHVENLAVGVSLAFRRRLRAGDHVVLGEHSGTVREVGLTSIQLRTADSQTAFLPNRLLNDQGILVTRAENTARVIVALHGIGALDTEQAARLRRIALLCPYRALNSPVNVRLLAQSTLEIEVQAQASTLVADAAAQLEAALRAGLDEK